MTDPTVINAWKEALLGLKEILALVALLWLLIYTYTRIIPYHLGKISEPIVGAMEALSSEMRELRTTLIDVLMGRNKQ